MYLTKEEIYKIILQVFEAYVKKGRKRQDIELPLMFSFLGNVFYTYHYDWNCYFKSLSSF